ncbi:MAG: hypothetical protein AAFN77_06915 [Planctomycetota bacterium]
MSLILTLAVAMLMCGGCSIFNKGASQSFESLNREIARSMTVGETSESASEHSPNDAVEKKRGAVTGSSSKVSKVRLDGSLSLGDTDNLAFTTDEMAIAFQDLLDAKKFASAITLVRLYPDITSKLMRENQSAAITLEFREQICELYASLWSSQSDAMDLLKRSYSSGTTNNVLKQHQAFQHMLENNQPREALKLRLSRQVSGNPVLEAEALRLEAMAHLMLEEHSTSSSKLAAAAGKLAQSQPLEANRIRLLLGETFRRDGQHDQWREAWKTAVASQSDWLESNELADPQFWKQAAFLRPISEQWPEVVIDRMRRFTAGYGLEFDSTDTDESVVWATIGLNSLRRHESQNAILSFKKAESTVSDRFLKKELQMQQAIAMIDGGQAGPASAILLRLSSQPGKLADRAKAVLATLKLQNGSLAQGMSLLQSAIKSSATWPDEERLRAQADYGLAYLMRGKEQQGVSLLNRVHDEFLQRSDFAQAGQCLFNIATYYEKTDRPREHKAAIARLDQLEAGAF